MSSKNTNARVRFIANFAYNARGNCFENIPNDLFTFLHTYDGGTMEGIVGSLYPDQLYSIEITIRSIDQTASPLLCDIAANQIGHKSLNHPVIDDTDINNPPSGE